MNNIEELSKPVAEVNSKYGDPEAFGERKLNVLADIQKMPYQTKFYSQEYVDALIAQLEAAQGNIKELESKVNHYVAAEYAHKHFDQTPDIIKRADSAELELVKVKAELLAAQKELGDLHNQEFQQRLANAEHQLYMKDLAIHNIKASRKAQFRKRLAAEAALSSANKKLNADPVLVCRINAGEIQRLKNGSYAIVDAPERNPTDMGLFTGTQQKPVVLPEAYAVRAGHPINEGERNVMIPKQGGNWLSRFDVEHAIRAAGGKVEGE
ncbi:TPA: hypothetical protein P0301_001746 [Yersinia enterocolitica]|nr:hypothetical protein [Yersinia enterocolitica]